MGMYINNTFIPAITIGVNEDTLTKRLDLTLSTYTNSALTAVPSYAFA